MDMTFTPDTWYENGMEDARDGTRLRAPTIHDTAAVLRVFCDAPDVTRHVAWQPMRTATEAREFLGAAIAGWADGRPSWFIEDAGSGEIVGSIIAATDGDEVEISYVVAPAWWGRGHATSAVRLVASGALRAGDVQRVRAYCDAENAASARVLEKAGFTLEARLPAYGVHNVAPDPRDCLAYVRRRD